jgi:hypothetical protein
VSRTKTLLAASTLAAACAGAASGCSSGSPATTGGSTTAAATAEPTATPATGAPNAGLSPAQLQAAYKAAVAAGSAVHVVGSASRAGTAYVLDLHLNKDGSSEGSIPQNGSTLPVKAVGGITYVQLTPAFLKQAATGDASITPAVIAAVQNKWVSSQSAVGQSFAGALAGYTDYDSFLAAIGNGGATASAGATGAASASASANAGTVPLSSLTADGTTTYEGHTVAVYKGAGGTTAYFAATGPAYLEKATATGADAGTFTFTWNQPVTVTAPPSADIFNG